MSDYIYRYENDEVHYCNSSNSKDLDICSEEAIAEAALIHLEYKSFAGCRNEELYEKSKETLDKLPVNCVDSDGGIDRLNKGTQIFLDSFDTFPDYCTANDTLIEHYCESSSDTYHNSEWYDCTESGKNCYNGTCVAP